MFAALLAACLIVPAAPHSLPAQALCSSMEECPGQVIDVGVQEELAVAGLNALLGGATAAVSRLVRGEPVWEGLLVGAAGGGAVYLGKRVAVEEFGGAGLLGREIASVGSSMIRNATAGRTAFDELVLPLGPVRLYINDGEVLPRVDLATIAAAGALMVRYDARLDAAASLSAGALVLRGNSPTPGLSSAGAILTWSDLPSHEGPRLLAHERIHILQYDQAFLSWAEPAERWLAPRAPVPDGLLRYIDVGGLALGLRTGLNIAVDYGHRPWEREAYLMSQITHPVPTDL